MSYFLFSSKPIRIKRKKKIKEAQPNVTSSPWFARTSIREEREERVTRGERNVREEEKARPRHIGGREERDAKWGSDREPDRRSPPMVSEAPVKGRFVSQPLPIRRSFCRREGAQLVAPRRRRSRS
ncbi:hypothetical protein EUGRSUZ_I00614 [Eucalyptus grandis]|uniref:Uncharacterized protein n=2 Tax=Eucalyptus grandis TaxID=71139 RepID=A0ACC3JFE2_EUCGR|nr:hypothetical protein EUGRSUZ_I00614 [Eucalyptus grandis]